jgi:hypothetical protein
MQTTTAEYLVSVRTDEGTLSVFRTMPTRPKTQKGIKSQNKKLEKWAMEKYPNWQEINIIPAFEATK